MKDIQEIRYFTAKSVKASKYGEHTTALRFFGPKNGNIPEDQCVVKFEGMNIDQLIAELQNIKVGTNA